MMIFIAVIGGMVLGAVALYALLCSAVFRPPW